MRLTPFTLAILSILFSATLFGDLSSGAEVPSFIDKFGDPGESIVGYSISAEETAITYKANHPALNHIELLKDHLSKEAIAELEKSRATDLAASTNTASVIYSIGSDVITIKTSRLDDGRHATLEEKTVNTSNAVFESHLFLSSSNKISGNSTIGEISNRRGSDVVGLPLFLSKQTLYGWLTSAEGLSLRTGTSLSGTPCHILDITRGSESPINKYELFISMTELSPIELNSYANEGSLFSRTRLLFDTQNQPSVCINADTEFFNNGQVFRHIGWRRKLIHPEDKPLQVDLQTFFTSGTRVSDQRFSKTLSYRVGFRLPTQEELQIMLTNANGIPIYEAATFGPLVSNHLSTKQFIMLAGLLLGVCV